MSKTKKNASYPFQIFFQLTLLRLVRKKFTRIDESSSSWLFNDVERLFRWTTSFHCNLKFKKKWPLKKWVKRGNSLIPVYSV